MACSLQHATLNPTTAGPPKCQNCRCNTCTDTKCKGYQCDGLCKWHEEHDGHPCDIFACSGYKPPKERS